MEKDGRACVVKIINYFDKNYKPLPYKSGFQISKKGTGLHGIGVKSVKNTAQKYGGYFK